FAWCGRRSEITTPDFPRGEKGTAGPSVRDFSSPTVMTLSEGRTAGGLPWSLTSRALKSNRSCWDGPPDMKRKITRFALAGYCAGWALNGLAALTASASIASRARAPNPQAVFRRNLRRLIGPKSELFGCMGHHFPGQGRCEPPNVTTARLL